MRKNILLIKASFKGCNRIIRYALQFRFCLIASAPCGNEARPQHSHIMLKKDLSELHVNFVHKVLLRYLGFAGWPNCPVLATVPGREVAL